MARPCGCSGECGCTIVGINGITVTGAGTTRENYRVALSNPVTGTGCDAIMSCVTSRLGQGLTATGSGGPINIRLSSDGGNNITFGSDGGIFSSGGAGGGDSGFATVAGLLGRANKVIGGSYGAGLSVHPEGPLDNYEQAMNMNLPLIHVPVRRSRDHFLWAVHHNILKPYVDADSFKDLTQDMDMLQGTTMQFYPGGRPVGDTNGIPNYETNRGYFGCGQPMRWGLTKLADVFGVVQRRSVLYLEVKDRGVSNPEDDPTSDDPAVTMPGVPVPFSTFQDLQPLLLQHGMTKSVIVGVDLPVGGDQADRDGILNGLELMRTAGVATALHFTSSAQFAAFPPAYLTQRGIQWAFFSYGDASNPANKATIRAYKDAGINCMLHSAHLQTHFDLLSDAAFGAGGLLGTLAWDPVYVGGKQNNYNYRSLKATWGWGTPDYGRHGALASRGWAYQSDHYRGYVVLGAGDQICLDGDVHDPATVSGGQVQCGYSILMGEQCPINYAREYNIRFKISWDQIPADTVRWAGLWFGVEHDRPLRDWNQATTDSQGWLLTLDNRPTLVLQRYDGIAAVGGQPAHQYLYAWDAGFGPGRPGDQRHLKIEVRNGSIAIGPSDQPVPGGLGVTRFTDTLPLDQAGRAPQASRHRGQYASLTRHFFQPVGNPRVRWHEFQIDIVTPA